MNFVTKGLDFQLIQKLEDLINEYKNVRSHLSKINIGLPANIRNYRYKSACISGEDTTIYPLQAPLVFDELNWDESYWIKPENIEQKLPVCIWDQALFDEFVWSFG